EKAQNFVTRAPDVLNGIMSDPKASAKHRIDSAKALDSLAGFSPEVARNEDRVVIHIDLGADTRAKGLPSAPGDVLHVEVEARPVDAEGRSVDATPQERPLIEADHLTQEEGVPVRRGPGRPLGSKTKNRKPKVVESESKPKGVPGFNI